MNDWVKISDDFAIAAKALRQRTDFFSGEVTTLTEHTASLAKGNVAALIESARIVAEGSDALAKIALGDVQRNMSAAATAVGAAMSGGPSAALLTLPVNSACSGSDSVVADGSRFLRSCIKLAGDAAQPLVTQFQVAIGSAQSAKTA